MNMVWTHFLKKSLQMSKMHKIKLKEIKEIEFKMM